MTTSHDPSLPPFDRYAEEYEELHRRSVASSGEDPLYFAEYKARVLHRLLPDAASPLLDFGCGIGTLTALLTEGFHDVHGYDPSATSLRIARERVPRARFHDDVDSLPDTSFAAAVVANVLHHVEPSRRDAVIDLVVRKLAPGGVLVVFEHNPWNPLTRRAVATCQFDEDAVLLPPWELPRRLRRAGLSRIRRDFIVFFPRSLRYLRRFEPRLRRCPFGAQICVHGVKG